MTRRTRWITAIACSAALFAVTGAFAADWPQWRGPERTGVSKETGLLKEWPKEGPKLLWQVKDIGYGFSTPAVAGGRMYLLSNRGLADEFVQSLDARNGKLLWATRIGKVGNPNQVPSYPGARSTTTLDGEVLYALGSDGDLVCLETASGKTRWHKNLRTDFGGQPGVWAYSESPLVDGDAVICTPGGSSATMVAVNKRSGDVIWKSAIPGADQAGYASPSIAEIGGVKQYIQFVQKGVVGVDAKSGKFLWRFDATAKNSPANIPTPIYHDGCVYSASAMGGGGLAKIKTNSGSFEAEQVYFSKKLPVTIGGVVRIGEFFYGTGSQTLQCVEFKTGNPRWDDKCVGPASVCYADGRLYLHGENGDVALVEATPDSYREKGRFTPPDQPERSNTKAWAYPVISNGRLYIRDLDRLWCYDLTGPREGSGSAK